MVEGFGRQLCLPSPPGLAPLAELISITYNELINKHIKLYVKPKVRIAQLNLD